jgi:peptide/nickel transport system substrate-binding protein
MIPRLEFRYYADQNEAIAALKTGQILAVADLSYEQSAALDGQPGITVYAAARASQDVILFNLSLPFFDDATVRHALLSAIDRPAIIKTVLRGNATISDGPFLSTSWAAAPTTSPTLYDADAARAALELAGWVDANKDGVRERNGVKLEFGLLTNNDATHVRVAQAVAQAWTQAGAAVEVQVIDAQNLVQDYLQPRRFEAVLFSWTDIADDPDPYEMWHSTQASPAGLNFTGFASHTVDEILEEARRSSNLARRQALYAEFRAIFLNQQPAIVLYEPMFIMAVANTVQSVRLSFISRPGDRFRYLGEWYTMTRTIVKTETQRTP